MADEIIQIRPLWTPKSNLFEVLYDPDFRWFFKYIEPKIVRGSFLPCWMWNGRMQVFNPDQICRREYPTVMLPPIEQGWDESGPKKMYYVHRYIASLFWQFPDTYTVYRTCREAGCVNPNHFHIAPKHHPDYQ